jgi:hypothetical protein
MNHMETQEIVITLLTAAVVYAAWVAVFMIVPVQMMSIFRHDLWRIRDRIVDDLLNESLPHGNYAVTSLLRSIESSIRHARHISLVSWLLIPPPTEGWVEKHKSALAEGYQALSEEQLAKLGTYAQQFRTAMAVHMFRGSPVGWGIFFIHAMRDAVRSLKNAAGRPSSHVDRILSDFAKTSVGEERLLQMQSTDARSGRNRLAACV